MELINSKFEIDSQNNQELHKNNKNVLSVKTRKKNIFSLMFIKLNKIMKN